MTRIVKSKDVAAHAVRPVGAMCERASRGPAPVVDPELEALRAERSALERSHREQAEQITSLSARITALEAEVERAYAEGEAIGLRLGLQQAEDDRTAALAKLTDGVEGALATLAREMNALERLAPALAQHGLSLIIGDPGRRTDLVADIIRRQISLLGAQAIVRVDVSARDFDAAELAGVLGRPGLDVRATDALGPGECRIKLSLGELEVGLDQQWGRLSALLAELTLPDAAA